MVLYLIVLNLNIFSDIDGDSSLALLKLEIIRFEHRELKFAGGELDKIMENSTMNTILRAESKILTYPIPNRVYF